MPQVQPAALPPGSRIAEYEIVRVLGAGGFGITYLAFDHQLDGPVALKEYFPADVATRADGSGVAATATSNQDLFAWGLDRFIQEARAIHRLRHPNVVRAHRYLEANGTAYIVLEYVEGEPLKAILDRRGRLSADEWRPWMDALLDGLAHVHEHGYLHRDIKPANIVVRSDNGEPVLIDFGSARLQHGDRTLTQVLTAGYAPIEQYSNDAAQGPQGDIYAMAAVSYRVLTGRTVPSAPDRVLNGAYEPLGDHTAGTDSCWLAAIDRGLAIRPEDRPQTVEEWREELGTAEVKSVNTESLGVAATEQGEHGDPSIKSLRRTSRPAVAAADAIECEVPGAPERPPAQQRFMRLWWAVPALVGLSLVALRLATGPIEDAQRAESPVRTSQSMNRRATPNPVPSARSASTPALSSLSPEASPIDPPSGSPSDATTLPVLRPSRPAIDQIRTPPSRAPAQVDRHTGSPSHSDARDDDGSVIREEGPSTRPLERAGSLMTEASTSSEDDEASGGSRAEKPYLTRGAHQDRPQLGVVLVEGSRLRPQIQGVSVWEVARNSGADRAGLRGARPARNGGIVLGDVITAIENQPVRSVPDIRAVLERHQPGDKVRVTLKRDGEEIETEVRLSAPPARPLGATASSGSNSTTEPPTELSADFTEASDLDRRAERPSFFTRGSHQDDVLRLQGTPSSINNFGAEERWSYGLSNITFAANTRTVTEWSNYRDQLHVRLLPGPNVTDRTYFTRGSHQDDVLRLQGTPSIINNFGAEERWSYGLSNITFAANTRTVTEWSNYRDQLHVRLLPGPNVTDRTYFTRGSHQDDVLRLQGTPSIINNFGAEERWSYGLSNITFATNTRTVTEWSNYRDQLKVELSERQ